MNKYMGFFELKEINIPTIPWQLFHNGTALDDKLLYTLRVAVERGSDFNLPRYVGIDARETYERGRELLGKYGENGMVIYYPYFIADKSGVLDIKKDTAIIEAVDKDLWNLVTYGRRDVTITIKNGVMDYIGDKNFLTAEEIACFHSPIRIIRSKFKDAVDEGKSILAEWSFAYDTDTERRTIGERYLVFYELRSI